MIILLKNRKASLCINMKTIRVGFAATRALFCFHFIHKIRDRRYIKACKSNFSFRIHHSVIK